MTPTVVAVPCFSGAPWDLPAMRPLRHRALRTFRLPEGADSMEAYADALAEEVRDLEDYVLVGDSFGAVVSLALAVRRPAALRALVLSGGFAADPVTTPVARMRVAAARMMPAALYDTVTLRFHASALASPHDGRGQHPWTTADTRRLFQDNTPHASYVSRSKAAFSADYRSQLGRIEVPTLVLTPSDDRLIGPRAAEVLLAGLPDASEVVLPRTGHMFRFSHPVDYAQAVEDFLAARVGVTTGVESH
ncbi:MAG: alpha/beta fold hydrolase [Mycobacteriaceae bacterium]